jgi:hypothetical protein
MNSLATVLVSRREARNKAPVPEAFDVLFNRRGGATRETRG